MNFNAISKNVKIIKIGLLEPKLWKKHVKSMQYKMKTMSVGKPSPTRMVFIPTLMVLLYYKN